MVPLLAASTAINTVDQLGSGALALWKQLTGSKGASKADPAGGSSHSSADSFAAMLPRGTGHSATASAGSSVTSASHGGVGYGHHSTAQRLDRLA